MNFAKLKTSEEHTFKIDGSESARLPFNDPKPLNKIEPPSIKYQKNVRSVKNSA